MFFSYLALSLGTLAVVCFVVQWLLNRGTEKEGWLELGALLTFVAILIFVAGFITSLFVHSNQIWMNVELTKIDSFEQTYQVRSDNLTKEFAHYLAQTYPDHEKDIFSKIEPGKVDVYLVKYPELQASKTIVELVNQIRSLQDDIYKQRLDRAEKVRDMQYNVRSPWVFQWMMPDISTPEK